MRATDRQVPETVVNTRVLQNPITGQPRYVRELLKRLPELQEIAPDRPRAGIDGHLWEQFVLPGRLQGRLLWSPSTTGPLLTRRQVVTMHDTAPLDHPEWFDPRFAGWYRFLLPRLAKRCSAIIAISDFCRDRLIHHSAVDPDKIVVIPNGVDDRFSPLPVEEVQATLRALDLSSRYVLALGSLEPRKNLSGLLDAWGEACHVIPEDVELVVAGAMGARHVFAPIEVKASKRVRFLGPVDDEILPALYAGATAFLFLSLYEGFGLPPLEAMACGTPVIASDRASIPEVVGDAGILVPPDDPSGASSALQEILDRDSLREGLIERGLRRARAFSWDRAAAEVWSLLAVIGQKR